MNIRKWAYFLSVLVGSLFLLFTELPAQETIGEICFPIDEDRFAVIRTNINDLSADTEAVLGQRLGRRLTRRLDRTLDLLADADSELAVGDEANARQKFRLARRSMIRYVERLERLRNSGVVPTATTDTLLGIGLDSVANIGNCCPKGLCCCTCQCNPKPCICTCTDEIIIN